MSLEKVRIYHAEGSESNVNSNKRPSLWSWITDLEYPIYYAGVDMVRHNILAANTYGGLSNVLASVSMRDGGWIGRSAAGCKIEFNNETPIDNIFIRNSDFYCEKATYLYDSLTISKNYGNDDFVAMTLANTYNPGVGDEAGKITLDFKVKATEDSGTTYYSTSIAKISAEKLGDFYGTDKTFQIGGLSVYVANSGSLTLSSRFERNGLFINAGTTKTGIADREAPFHVRQGSITIPAIFSTPTIGLFSARSDCNVSILTDSISTSSILFSDPNDEDSGAIKYYHANNTLVLRNNAIDRAMLGANGLRISQNGVSTASITQLDVIQGTPSSISTSAIGMMSYFVSQTNAIIGIISNPGASSKIYMGNYSGLANCILQYDQSNDHFDIYSGATRKFWLDTYGLNIGNTVNTSPTAKIKATQIAGVLNPVIELEQPNTSTPINHVSAYSQADLFGTLVASSTTFANSYTIKGWTKIQITDAAGRVVNGEYYIPFCTIGTI